MRFPTLNDAQELKEKVKKSGLDVKDSNVGSMSNGLIYRERVNFKIFRILSDCLNRLEEEKEDIRPDYKEDFRPIPTAKDGINEGQFHPFITKDTNTPVGFYLDDLTKGAWIIYGATRKGKTYGINVNLYFLVGLGIPCTIFSLKEGEFDWLAKAFPRRVLILGTDGRLKDNIWYPPRGFEYQYLSDMVNIIKKAYDRHDSAVLLAEVMKDALNQFEPEKGMWSQFEIHERLATRKFPKGFANTRKLRESIMIVSKSLIDSTFSETLDCAKGLDEEERIKRGITVVIEIGNLKPEEQVLYITSKMRKIYYINRSLFPYDNSLHAISVVDEATFPFHVSWDRKTLSPLSELPPLIMHSGQGLIVGCHSPHQISEMLRANVWLSVCFGIDAQDIPIVKNSMSLTPDMAEYIIHQQQGEAVIRRNERFTHPIPVIVPSILKLEHVTKDEIEKSNEEILSTLPPIIPRNETMTEIFLPSDTQQSGSDNIVDITSDEKLLCYTAFIELTTSITGLQKKLKWSGEKITRITKSIEEKGLCCFLELNLTGKRGGLAKYLVLTEKSIQLLNLPGYLEKSRGGTNIEHQYLQRLISDSLNSKSYKTETERNI